MEQKRYVVGLAFNAERTQVAMIRKNRPEWQAGLLNGIGGKIEKGETPAEAMCREFEEEAGVRLSETDWQQFLEVNSEGYTLYIFRTTTALDLLQQMTDEEVVLVSLPDDSYRGQCIPNLNWIIPMAMDSRLIHARAIE